MNVRERIIEGLVLILLVAVAARFVWGLIGSIVPSLLVLLVCALLITRLVSGPRSRH